MSYQITDTITGKTITTEDLRAALAEIVPGMEQEAEALATATERGEYAGDLEAYLGVEVTAC